MGARENRAAMREKQAGELKIKQPPQGGNHLLVISAIFRRKQREAVWLEIDERIAHNESSTRPTLVKRKFTWSCPLDCQRCERGDGFAVMQNARLRKLMAKLSWNKCRGFVAECARGTRVVCVRNQDSLNFPQCLQLLASVIGQRNGIDNDEATLVTQRCREKLGFDRWIVGLPDEAVG